MLVVVRLGFRSAPSTSVFVCSLQFLPFAMMNCRIHSYLEPGKPSASRGRKCSLINPKLPPIDHWRPQMKLTSRIGDTSILPLTLLDASIAYRLADQAGNGIFMRYSEDEVKKRLDNSPHLLQENNAPRLPCSPSRRILTAQCPRRILSFQYPIYPMSTFMGNSFVGHLSGRSF